MNVSLHHDIRKYQALQTRGISALNRSKTRHVCGNGVCLAPGIHHQTRSRRPLVEVY
jgi:hypothetical protein